MSNTNSSEQALITFIRVPELGKVKTRLAADVGDSKALEIYNALLDHTRQVCLEVSCHKYLFYAPRPAKDNWSPDHFIKKAQKGNDLGERMSNAFKLVLAHHRKVVIIGSDCPQLTSTIVNKAFLALENNDVVIGPTFDGGYFLLGMNSYNPFLFEDIKWSSDSVYSQTIEKLKEKKLSHYTLKKLSDVDYAEDWNEHGWEL